MIMEFWNLIKKNGLLSTVIVGIGILIYFYWDAKIERKVHKEKMIEMCSQMDEFQNDLKDYSRIASDLRYELFVYRMEQQGVDRDTTGVIIINN